MTASHHNIHLKTEAVWTLCQAGRRGVGKVRQSSTFGSRQHVLQHQHRQAQFQAGGFHLLGAAAQVDFPQLSGKAR